MSLGLAQSDKFSPLFHTFPHPHAKAAGLIVPSREGCQGLLVTLPTSEKGLEDPATSRRKAVQEGKHRAGARARACCVSFMIFNE